MSREQDGLQKADEERLRKMMRNLVPEASTFLPAVLASAKVYLRKMIRITRKEDTAWYRCPGVGVVVTGEYGPDGVLVIFRSSRFALEPDEELYGLWVFTQEKNEKMRSSFIPRQEETESLFLELETAVCQRIKELP
jgi:hypothetical protein